MGVQKQRTHLTTTDNPQGPNPLSYKVDLDPMAPISLHTWMRRLGLIEPEAWMMRLVVRV
jgi:hypothetical protein